MQLKTKTIEFLSELGQSLISASPYDTAWMVRLQEIDEDIANGALEWLRKNQLPDGAWGAREINYRHDRIVCTLAAMIALSRTGEESDKKRIERARLGLDVAFKGLTSDISGATVGFEAIVPRLLEEAYDMGAIRREGDKYLFQGENSQQPDGSLGGRREDIFKRLHRKKAKMDKIARKKDAFINRQLTAAFSAEMVGDEGIHLLDVDHLQESNGSIGCSPSATAFYASFVNPGEQAAMSYIRNLTQQGEEKKKGVPVVAPFDIFETAWALWNLSIVNGLGVEIREMLQPHLDVLEDCWDSDSGLGFSCAYTPADGDDTSLVFDVLRAFERDVDIKAVLRYKKDNHFCCYHTEADASVSANIHVLGALKQAGYSVNDKEVQGILNFLSSQQLSKAFWCDKWHASPYYPTSHIIVAGAGFVPDGFLSGAVTWMKDTQRQDGSWGYYQRSTAEETAYCLQALMIWMRNGGNVSNDILKKGLTWLKDHMDGTYPPLWICKCLYAPELIVRSTILSALWLGDELC